MHEARRQQRATQAWHDLKLTVCLALTLLVSVPVSAQKIPPAQESSELPLAAFYQHVDHQLVWQDAERVEALVAALEGVADDGLTPSHYGAGKLKAEFQRSRRQDAAARSAFDRSATRALLEALDHLQHGKLNPRELLPRWDGPPRLNALPVASIAQAVTNGEVEQAFAQMRPQQAYYQSLRDELSAYRAIARQGSAPLFPSRDSALRPGDRDDDVIALRQRLTYWGEPGLLSGNPEAYPQVRIEEQEGREFDRTLETALKRFQRRHLLEADGVVGDKTRRALNTPVATRVGQLRVNLERGRWMAPWFSHEPHVWVDIAGYRMAYLRPDGTRWSSRVVVGSSRRETPVIHSRISHLTVNPSWTLPPTIMREDILPQVRKNPDYLSERGLKVINYSGEVLDPSTIDWASPDGIMLRQPAGSSNPLGRIVVRFPNNEMIYLHDTPAQGLFGRDKRALSSGCVRVEGVRELARMLLKDTGSRYRLEALLNTPRSDMNVSLPEAIPVALHYITAWPDAAGEVTFREDIYRRDQRILDALATLSKSA